MIKFKLKAILIIAIIAMFTISCESEEEINLETPSSVSFVKMKNTFIITSDDDNSQKIEIATSKAFSTDRVFEITIDSDQTTASSAEYSLSTLNITIPAGELVGSTDVLFDFDSLVEGEIKLLYLEIVEFDGDNRIADLQSNRTLKTTVKFFRPCTSNLLTLDITFDAYPEESGWEIMDSSGDIVFSKVADVYRDMSTASELICLDAGDYTFNFNDSYGDGLGSGGEYELKLGTTVYVTGSGNFGTSQSTSFTID